MVCFDDGRPFHPLVPRRAGRPRLPTRHVLRPRRRRRRSPDDARRVGRQRPGQGPPPVHPLHTALNRAHRGNAAARDCRSNGGVHMERQVAIVAYQGVLADETHAFRSVLGRAPDVAPGDGRRGEAAPSPGRVAPRSSTPRSTTSATRRSSSLPGGLGSHRHPEIAAWTARRATRRSCSPARPARPCSPPPACSAGRTAATHWLAGPLLERHGVTVSHERVVGRRPVRDRAPGQGSALDAAFLVVAADLGSRHGRSHPRRAGVGTSRGAALRGPHPLPVTTGADASAAAGDHRRRGRAGGRAAPPPAVTPATIRATERRGIIDPWLPPPLRPPIPPSGGRAPSCSATARAPSSARSARTTRRRWPRSTTGSPARASTAATSRPSRT